MKVHKIKGILFDMDGVLVDSNTEVENFWRAWAVKENVIITDHIIAEHIYGRTTADTIKELFQHSHSLIKEQIVEDAIAFDRNLNPSLIKDAERFIREMASGFQKIAVVTSAPLERTLKILELHNISRFFTCCVTGDEITMGKPDPEPYLLAAAKLKLHPKDCLVLEDSNSGILSALTAGMYVIAVNNQTYQNDSIISHIMDYTELQVHNHFIRMDKNQLKIELMTG
ncbi:MAG: HAD family phosphatase [Chitinophagaceae bacterium]